MVQPHRAAAERLPVAVVVEDDEEQRNLLGTIFEESGVQVIVCDSADAAVRVMETVGTRTVFMFADIPNPNELTHEVESRWPHTRLVTTSETGRRQAPTKRTRQIGKPWRALDLIIELERALATH